MALPKNFFIILIPTVLIGVLAMLTISLKQIQSSNTETNIQISDQYCQTDNDCVMAVTECSCDCGTPINKANQQKYSDIRATKCKNYVGVMCGMSCDHKLSCVSNRCAAIRNLAD